MKTKYIISLLATVIFIFFISCEEDLLQKSDMDSTLEVRGKGGNKGKPNEALTGIVLTDLGTPGGYMGRINAVEIVEGEIQIVGSAEAPSGDTHAYLWTESNGWQDLGFLYESYPYSEANDINESGNIIGWSSAIIPPFYSNNAVTWSSQDPNPMGTLNDINPTNSVNSSAEAINSWGDMVGSRVDTCGYEGYSGCGPGSPGDTLSIWSAFMWKNESNILENVELRTLFGHSWAHGINNNRVAVGRSDLSVFEGPNHFRAVVWEYKDGDSYVNPIVIPGLENLWSWARDINDFGQIVGEYDTLNGNISSSSALRGFLAKKNELDQWEYNKLPTLGTRTIPYAISQSGYVTGTTWEITSNSKGRTRTKATAFLFHEDIGDYNDGVDMISLGNYSGGGRSDAYDLLEKSENEIIVVGTGEVSGSRHTLMWTINLCEVFPDKCQN